MILSPRTKLNPFPGLVPVLVVSVALRRCEPLSPPGLDTKPSQVSSQQKLVITYLPRKDGKPELALAAKVEKIQISAKPTIEPGTLVVKCKREPCVCQRGVAKDW